MVNTHNMASFRALCIIALLSANSVHTKRPANICMNQWELEVEGLNQSEIAVHHSSSVLPGQVTHLVWHWLWQGELSTTLWLTQKYDTGYFEGGLMLHPKYLYHLPTSFKWVLANRSLGVTTFGDILELTLHPEWSISVCQGELIWGVTADKELYIMYDGVNETRSLDESWAVDGRLKRQVEFLDLPQLNFNNTLTSWWRRFIDSLSSAPPGDDRARSWIMDLTELLLKVVFSGFRNQRQFPEIPSNPEAEDVPEQRFRDVEPMTESSRPFRFPKNIHSSIKL